MRRVHQRVHCCGIWPLPAFRGGAFSLCWSCGRAAGSSRPSCSETRLGRGGGSAPWNAHAPALLCCPRASGQSEKLRRRRRKQTVTKHQNKTIKHKKLIAVLSEDEHSLLYFFVVNTGSMASIKAQKRMCIEKCVLNTVYAGSDWGENKALDFFHPPAQSRKPPAHMWTGIYPVVQIASPSLCV